MSSSRLHHSRLPLRLTALQEHPVVLLLMPCELPETTAGAKAGVATGRLMINHQINHKALETLTMARIRLQPVATKLTCPSPTTTTGARGPRFHAGDEVLPYTTCERHSSFARQTEWKKHKLCLCFPYHYNYTYYNVYPKGLQAYRLLLQTTMEPLPHGLLVLSSSKPLTGRTGHKLKDASTTGTTWRHHYSLVYRNPPPDKDSSRQPTTCLVGHTSIEATTTPATGTTRPSRKPTPRRRQTSHRAPP